MDGDTIFGADFDFSSEEESSSLPDREARTFQSEDDFLRQKSSWTPKIENREVVQIQLD